MTGILFRTTFPASMYTILAIRNLPRGILYYRRKCVEPHAYVQFLCYDACREKLRGHMVRLNKLIKDADPGIPYNCVNTSLNLWLTNRLVHINANHLYWPLGANRPHVLADWTLGSGYTFYLARSLVLFAILPPQVRHYAIRAKTRRVLWRSARSS